MIEQVIDILRKRGSERKPEHSGTDSSDTDTGSERKPEHSGTGNSDTGIGSNPCSGSSGTHPLTLSVAESCTGGRLAAAFTARAGASEYFAGGVVTYSNEAKINILGVSRETLEKHGAVSREVAEQMAACAIEIFGTDVAAATTGIAGPGGGTPEKPVGTVHIAVATRQKTTSRPFHFTGSREENMASAVAAAIEMILTTLNDRNDE